MNLKKNHYSRRALALLLTLVMCVHDPHRLCRPAEQLPRPRRALDAGVRPYQ